jgi:hypothetical protein
MSKEKRDGKTFPQTVDRYLEVVRWNLQTSAEYVDSWSDCYYYQTSRIKALANNIQRMSDELFKIRIHGLPIESEKTVGELKKAIQKLRGDRYQKAWLGWLSEYNTSGPYNRIPSMNRTASYAYNHLLAPRWLLWVASAAKVSPTLIKAARAAVKTVTAKSPAGLQAARAAMVRKHVPWTVLATALWPKAS